MLKDYLLLQLDCGEDSIRIATTDQPDTISVKVGSAGLFVSIGELKEAIKRCEIFNTREIRIPSNANISIDDRAGVVEMSMYGNSNAEQELLDSIPKANDNLPF